MDNPFSWSRLGDIEKGRGKLGVDMPVAVYRLFQYTMMDELKARCGKEEAEEIFRSAGFRAGRSFAENVLEMPESFDAFVAGLQAALRQMKIGILRIEKSDMENLRFILTVSEDLDCSGLPVTDETVCIYDEGFIAGIMEAYTGRAFDVREIDCWASGGRTCRFTVNVRET